MPTYPYICTSCHYEWEADHSISTPPLTKCPKCQEETAQRQIAAGGSFILAGGGWAKDNYGK